MTDGLGVAFYMLGLSHMNMAQSEGEERVRIVEVERRTPMPNYAIKHPCGCEERWDSRPPSAICCAAHFPNALRSWPDKDLRCSP